MTGTPSTKDAYALMHAGSLCLADMEAAGQRIDLAYLDKAMVDTAAKARELEAELKKDEVYKVWRREYGEKTNFRSHLQLGHVLFDVLKHKSTGETATGRWKSDKNALQTLDIPFVKQYLQIMPLLNVGTRLAAIKRETVDGYFHPNFNLHLARTYRSSSGSDKESEWEGSSVNSQNNPVRNKEIAEIISRCFVPRDGHRLIYGDFKGIEVSVGACYHKDPTMIAYLNDKSSDMHRDMAEQLYMLDKDQMTKMVRFSAKSFFVFAQFYGDYYIHCAKGLWDAIDILKLTTVDGTPLAKHLRRKGIKELGDLDPKQPPRPGTFEKHVQEVERDFWGNRFKVYAQWKKERWQEYQRDGYFDSLTGFRYWGTSGKGGMVSRNDCSNWPVQGSAFHCLLWVLIQLNKWIKKYKMRTRLIGQVHDSATLDCHEDELQDCLNRIKEVADNLPKHWPWIITPMSIEYEVAPFQKSGWEKSLWVLENGIWGPEKKV